MQESDKNLTLNLKASLITYNGDTFTKK